MDKLQTGDIILFHTADHWYNRLIEKVTRSPLCHSAIILKDPWCTERPLQGLYVIQSTYDGRKDVEDNKIKLGVQVTRLVDVLKDYDWAEIRTISGIEWNKENKNKLTAINAKVHDIPYDFGPKHWLMAAFNHLNLITGTVERHTDSMWCSALCAYIYTEMGWLPSDTNWSELAPSDLATIEVNTPFTLSEPWKLEINEADIGNAEERESLLYQNEDSEEEWEAEANSESDKDPAEGDLNEDINEELALYEESTDCLGKLNIEDDSSMDIDEPPLKKYKGKGKERAPTPATLEYSNRADYNNDSDEID